MAESYTEPDPLSCSICLDVLKNPVTLHCGHSYCIDCINGCWDLEDQGSVYRCPQCRHTFLSRPVLNKNTVLADLVEKLGGAEPTCPARDEVSPGDVECDVCTVRKLKAVKSCLVCLASYCTTHLQPHYESAAFKRHKLVEVSASLQEKICSKHDKLLEVYCRSDEQCICQLCVMDEHKGHDTVLAAAERERKQKQFGKKTQRYQQGIQEKEKQLRQLRQKMKALTCSADAAVDQNEKAYAEIVLMADKRRCAVKEQIQVQEKAAMSKAEALVDQLEKDVSELRKREDELMQLSLTEDHVHFLQSYQSMCDRPEPDMSSNVNVQLHASFDFVTKANSDFREKLESMVQAVGEISVTIQADPGSKTRTVVREGALKKMLKQYKYRDLTLREITNVISQYKDLKPVMDAYVFNDGSTRDLMGLAGTVPVSYRGNVYNIPVCLWLLDTYPYNPPICFVEPTSAMMIKTGKHIAADGKIYLPYLHEWKHPTSDLYGLIQVMIVLFGEEPPVFSRPTSQAPLTNYFGV
ncbi:E3 ubiquitin/ISG15 ligase TRIM25-like [Thunnus albacares]|uniref:E3 ubiquitin/ISG15 ligase TRIM25-like n=1 Tax=Thunnus albacares TaxID=8236 RepID=UPI001CF64A6D|nr:E3 ubiquitin/ISG15 ligase TRIM25-like [Thunnus albacares]